MAMAGTGLDPNSPDYLKLRKTVAGQVAQGYGTDPSVDGAAPQSLSPDFVTKDPAPPSTSTSPRVSAAGNPYGAGIPPPSPSPPYLPVNPDGSPQLPTDAPRVTVQPPPAPPVAVGPQVAPPTATTAPAAFNPSTWITEQLGAVESTDDNAYWQRQAAKDPKFMAGDESAKAWWLDAIRRGEGSKLVKSGELSLRPAGGPPGGSAADFGARSGANSLQPPAATSVLPGKPPNSTSGSNHRPGDGTGVAGVYDWNNAGYPVDAMGAPYRGALQGGEPNPWETGGGTEGFPADSGSGSSGNFNDEIRRQLMARLKELGTPVDENSAGITSAVSAARDEGTRAGENERTALAERLYAQGGGGLQSNALTQQIQQSGEKQGAAIGGLRANLIMGEFARKQGQLQQTLQLAVQSGDAEAARAAQKAIADLQAQLQREGFGIDLAKYQAYLNQHAVELGLG